VARDPYTRVASNYHNKINRYAKRFDLCAYLCSYLGQALGGTTAWRSRGDRIRRMRAGISFDRFVRGLQRHGVAWDEHFRLQTQVLRVEDVSYHKIVRMEHLAAGLREVFACAGVGVAGETAIARLAWLNRSDTAKAPDLWTPAARAIVADIYRRDFETLGYPT